MKSGTSIRMTSQRRVILDIVRASRTHPTADEVYERVRRKLPKISLATVYRNLEALSREGLINKLELGSSQKRFDPLIDDHYHIRCSICHKIEDVPKQPGQQIDSMIKKISKYKITGHTLEFTGICPECQN
ncbi:MAG TPA: transcriptional repressor [bacterium]